MHPLSRTALAALLAALAGCATPRPLSLSQWTDDQLKESVAERGHGHHLAAEIVADRARVAGRLDEALTYYLKVADEAPAHERFARTNAHLRAAELALRLRRYDLALRHALAAERGGAQGNIRGGWHATTPAPPPGHPLLLIRAAYEKLPADQRTGFTAAELRHAERHPELLAALHDLAKNYRRADPATNLITALRVDALRRDIYGEDCPLAADQLIELNWLLDPVRRLPSGTSLADKLGALALDWAGKPTNTTFHANARGVLHAAMDAGFRPTDAWWDAYLATNTFRFVVSQNPEAQRLAAIRHAIADGAILRANGLRLRELAAAAPASEQAALHDAVRQYFVAAAAAGDADSALEVARTQIDQHAYVSAGDTLNAIRPGRVVRASHTLPALTPDQAARLAALRADLAAGIAAKIAALESAARSGDTTALNQIAYAHLLGDKTIPLPAAPEKAAPWFEKLVAHPQVTADLLRRARGNLALLRIRGLGTPPDRPGSADLLLRLDGLETDHAATVVTLLSHDAATPADTPLPRLDESLFRPWVAGLASQMSATTLAAFTAARDRLAAAADSPRVPAAAAKIASLARAEATKLRHRAESLRRDAATAHAQGFVFQPTQAEQQFLNDYANLGETRRIASAPVPTKKETITRGEVYKYDGIYYKHTVTGDKTVVVDMTPQEIAAAKSAKEKAMQIVAGADAAHKALSADLAQRRMAFEARVESGRSAASHAATLEKDFVTPLESLAASLDRLAAAAPRQP